MQGECKVPPCNSGWGKMASARWKEVNWAFVQRGCDRDDFKKLLCTKNSSFGETEECFCRDIKKDIHSLLGNGPSLS